MPQTKNVDISPGGTTPIINVSQDDVGREIVLNAKDGSGYYDLTGCTVKLAGLKPSGLGFSVTGTVSGHQVTIATTKQMTDEYGQIACELQITEGTNKIGTANMILAVEKNPHPDNTTDGSADEVIPELTVLVERVEAAADSIHDLSVGANTLAPGSAASATYDEETNKITFGIPEGGAGETGATGNGIASIVKTGTSGLVDTYTITYTNGNTATFTVTNGADGQDGQDGQDGSDGADGYSPSASVSKSGDTTTITITDKNGTTTVTVSDGADGQDGQDGADGQGVPSGGTTGQVLAKKSNTDFDTEWVDGGGVGVLYPVSINIVTPPTKTRYEVGESFDPTGMVVQMIISDGTTRSLNNSDLAFSPSVFSTTGNQSVTITYSGLEPYILTTTQSVSVEAIIPNTWAKRAQIGRAGLGKQYFEVGEEITDTYTVGANTYTNKWIVVGFEDVEDEQGDTYTDVPIIQMAYTTHENVVFDAAENTEATEETAQEGFYYCGWDGSSTYTMLALSTGDTIPYGDYTKVYKTLWNSVNPIRYGLNNWKLSFARQYLNNSGTGWAAPQHACDVLPNGAANMTGFKSFMPADMISALHPIKKSTKQSSYMGGGTDITYDMFWLASLADMNIKDNNIEASDGSPWDYYKELSESDVKVNPGTYAWMIRYAVNATTSAQNWWARSANLGNMSEWFVNSSGSVGNYGYPSYSYRLLPACALI